MFCLTSCIFYDHPSWLPCPDFTLDNREIWACDLDLRQPDFSWAVPVFAIPRSSILVLLSSDFNKKMLFCLSPLEKNVKIYSGEKKRGEGQAASQSCLHRGASEPSHKAQGLYSYHFFWATGLHCVGSRADWVPVEFFFLKILLQRGLPDVCASIRRLASSLGVWKDA